MKNKKIIILINIFFCLCFTNLVFSEEFNFKSSEIIFLDNGNKVKGINGIELVADNGIRITGKAFDYDKIRSILNVKGNVIVYDDLNEIILRSEKFTYLKKQELIFTKTKTIIEYDKEYFLDAEELTFDRDQKKIFSEKKINIKDLNGNISLMSKFNLSLTTKLLIGDDLEYLDSTSNKIYMKNAAIDYQLKKLLEKTQ